MNKKVAIILGNFGDYAEKYLPDCIDGLRAQDWTGEKKIFIYDNASTEKSRNYLKRIVPEAEIIVNQKNDGFAKGNNDAIKKALEQGFDYIALFNLDMVFEPDCLSKMIEVAELDSRLRGNDKGKGGNDNVKIGAVQARIMLWPEKEKINSLGNMTHFLGFGYCKGYGQEYKNCHSGGSSELSERLIESSNVDKNEILSLRSSMTARNICYPSGAAVLFKAEVLKKVGLFDEEFWMYNEDQDLGWRIWLAGFKCILASEAVAYHKYEFSRSIQKYYWMDRNRILVMLKNYHWFTLILIFPAFVIMEIGLLLFSLNGGWIKDKLRVWGYFLSAKNWHYIIRARQASQKLRKIKDRHIIKMFSGRIWYQEIGDWKLRLINPIFNAYWWLVKKIIWW